MKGQGGFTSVGILIMLGVLLGFLSVVSMLESSFSHAKNSASLASQARLLSVAVASDYLQKCSSGSVTQATWVDLQAHGINQRNVLELRKYLLGWHVYDDANPKVELSLQINDTDSRLMTVELKPGIEFGNVYKWTTLVTDNVDAGDYSYLKLHNKRCGL